MNSIILVVSNWFYFIALALWIGGTIAIGAVVAPVAFRSLESAAAAGAIVGDSFKRFNYIVYVCGVVLALTSIIQVVLNREHSFWGDGDRLWSLLTSTRFVLLFVMISVALYLGMGLTSKMDEVRERASISPDTGEMLGEEGEQFNRMHREYVNLTRITLLSALGVALLAEIAAVL